MAYQIKKHNDELAAQAAYAAKMELAALEQAKKDQAERKKNQPKPEQKKIEPEKVVPETRATVKFTAPVIKDDKDVKEEMPRRGEKGRYGGPYRSRCTYDRRYSRPGCAEDREAGR